MTAVQPEFIIHSSASFLTDKGDLESFSQLFHSIVSEIYQPFNNKESTINDVFLGCQGIESKLRFNVVISSELTFDRLVHMTTWLMDRTKQIFSRIIKVYCLKNFI